MAAAIEGAHDGYLSPVGDPAFAESVVKALADAGYVIVPREPTEAMIVAGAGELSPDPCGRDAAACHVIWPAMVDAALIE